MLEWQHKATYTKHVQSSAIPPQSPTGGDTDGDRRETNNCGTMSMGDLGGSQPSQND